MLPGVNDAPSVRALRIGFLLLPELSMMALSAALEPLRAANRVSGRRLFEWQLFSVDGRPVVCSNGIEIGVAAAIGALPHPDMLVVCAGLKPCLAGRRDDALRHLRCLQLRGTVVGALSTGTFVLAEAGVLENRRCTVHWEYEQLFRLKYPTLRLESDLFAVDRKVFTCSGGIAALDMMLDFIGEIAGQTVALAVANQFLHPQLRGQSAAQRPAVHVRYRISNGRLAAVIALMESSLEEPLGLHAIAQQAGVTVRQLQRLFRRHLAISPRAFYLELRLRKARLVIEQTTAPLWQVALECGFETVDQFRCAYWRRFGMSAGALRRKGKPAATAADDGTAEARPR